MIVLHTSDWHLGKRLHKIDLRKDHTLFFDWLLDTIAQYKVELLLVSGDIFDTAYPSQDSLEAYYHFLARLIKQECKVIVTGGNHDSPNTLNAPSEILQYLDIRVVGGNEPDILDSLVPVYDENRNVSLVVAAVPFLRDADLQLEGPDDTMEDRVIQVRQAILHYYRELAVYAEKHYPGIPAIAMGHLFASGVTTSESERTIQVGNLAAIDAAELPTYFRYYAFGHIHKAQWIGGLDYVRYCGSPIALSFAEADYAREILLIDTEKPFQYKNTITYVPQSLPIPEFRKLIRLKGSFEALEEQLSALEHAPLPSLVEMEVEEAGEANFLMPAARAFMKKHSNENCWIIHHKINAKGTMAVQHFSLQQSIDTITPEEVFETMIQEKSEKEKLEMKQLFSELWSIVQQELKEKETLYKS